MDMPFDSSEVSYRYIVGIDLGTTNSALAYVDLTVDDSTSRKIRFLDIPQLTAPGELNRRLILPSFLYNPGPYELPPHSTSLPWDPERGYAVGEFAREQGSLVPGRLVASAKSWLCHGGVDRTAAILPWAVGADVQKVSPVEASARYLQHLREAWNEDIARGREGYRLQEQLIVLTVPASFDEVARELTVTAAREAGLPRVILVEEPLAAFYAWLSRHEGDWASSMCEGQMILVCDVGGGTTDFTIIAVRRSDKGLRFDRLAVGEHLMLGGDNMDLSLARYIEAHVVGKPGQLDSRRWHQLWHQCRKAKEVLLGQSSGEALPEASASESVTITVTGSGSKLIADTLKGTLTADLVRELILDGFFPHSAVGDTPQTSRRTGLTEWGLPYVQDPAITRHLAAFWQRYRTLLQKETGRTSLYPDFILFNGGALTPGSVRSRIHQVVRSWFEAEAGSDWSPVELDNPRPELAVAVGAAYYGLVRQGAGVRVGAGSPRAYYVEVSISNDLEPLPEETKAVCLVPRGAEEGFDAQLRQPTFELLTNKPASFQLFTSFTRLGDRLGDVVSLPEDQITRLPPIRTVLRYGKRSTARGLPVQLAIHLTEVGTLELWCQSLQSPHRWQLQFDVRELGDPLRSSPSPDDEIFEASVIERAEEVIRKAFCHGNPAPQPFPKGSAAYLRTTRPPSLVGWGRGRVETSGIQHPHPTSPVKGEELNSPALTSPVKGEEFNSTAFSPKGSGGFDGADVPQRVTEGCKTGGGVKNLPERLSKDLVSILELSKERWPTSLIRKLADTLHLCSQGRSITPQHESRWLNLHGFCLRPGFGAPLDDWRMKEIWKIYPSGLQFPRQLQCRSEWWIFWRRVAGGLTSGQQWHIYQNLLPHLHPTEKKKAKSSGKGPISRGDQEELEIWMALANFEYLPAATKVELGSWILERMRKGRPRTQEFWALGRLGARVPFFGPLDGVIPSKEASLWLHTILSWDLKINEPLARALVHMVSRTGDRARDLPPADIEVLSRWLEKLPKSERFQELLTNPEAAMLSQEREWVFGETLPAGLKLVASTTGRK
jgi:hypothetical protein